MAKSYTLMVRCPETGLTVDTGVKTSGREALNGGVFRKGRQLCPHCGQVHSYDRDAFLTVDRDASSQDLWRPNT
jgi:hypothetical protein